jgi:diguanylate cyclase (GGDEF)-like protein
VHYCVAIALLIGILGFNHIVQQRFVAGSFDHARLIDNSGQQRMLSQRIYLLAEDYHRTGSLEVATALDEAIARFERNHSWILSRIGNAPETNALYFDPSGPMLHAQTQAYAVLAKEIRSMSGRGDEPARKLLLLKRQGMWQILPRLEQAVENFTLSEEQENQRLRAYLNYSFYAALLVLLIEGALIFWPAHRAVVRHLGKLEASTEQVREKNDELRNYAQQMAYNAYHDPLTGLTNRKRLFEFLGAELAQPAQRARICVLHIDLDGFKQLNDRLGHAIGDVALQHAAKEMLDRVRGSDLVARTGGDEFVIVAFISGGDPIEQADRLCADLIARISKPFKYGGVEVHVGASIGYAFATDHTPDADELVAQADLALYEAKRDGKGTARRFSDGMNALQKERSAMLSDLESGVENGEFVPYFQPIQCLASGKIMGLELLARWNHPDGRTLPLDHFTKIAEEARLLDSIGSRVQLDGLGAFSTLRQNGWTFPRLSLNVFVHAMQYEDFADRLLEAVTAHGFFPGDVIVEVKETVLLSDAEHLAAQTISRLRKFGFHVHVDNFGVGFSSLSVLSQLDVNGVKIDRQLIASIGEPKTQQVVSAIIGLGKALSLQVFATGIETSEQYETLRGLGIDAAQGNLIAEPMSIDATLDWLHDNGSGNAPTARLG